ncbi:MAG: hypothetical protein WCJ05_01325 [bacterium]
MLASNSKGDTIVEVLIALAIIGSVIITSSLAVDGIATNNRNNYIRQQAIQVLQNQMELVKAANIYIPEYSLNNIFNVKVGAPLSSNTSNKFCVYVQTSPIQFKTDTSNCKFNQIGDTNGSTGFYDIKLYLVKVSIPPNYYNLQGEIDWIDQGKTSQSNAKLTYELVNNQ